MLCIWRSGLRKKKVSEERRAMDKAMMRTSDLGLRLLVDMRLSGET